MPEVNVRADVLGREFELMKTFFKNRRNRRRKRGRDWVGGGKYREYLQVRRGKRKRKM